MRYSTKRKESDSDCDCERACKLTSQKMKHKTKWKRKTKKKNVHCQSFDNRITEIKKKKTVLNIKSQLHNNIEAAGITDSQPALAGCIPSIWDVTAATSVRKPYFNGEKLRHLKTTCSCLNHFYK